jgi:hypothetical protein
MVLDTRTSWKAVENCNAFSDCLLSYKSAQVRDSQSVVTVVKREIDLSWVRVFGGGTSKQRAVKTNIVSKISTWP